MPATSQVNIALIGAGAVAATHLHGYREHPAARVTALAEPAEERGRQLAARFGVPECVPDYRMLLDREDIHVFSVALPNHLHAPVTLAALRAGKHVFLEKPMATNAADAAALAAEAQARKRVLMVGQNNRFAAEVQAARRLVVSGVLGEVYHARTAWTRRAGIPRIGSWFTQKQYAGGGCAYDIGVHALDRCLWLMGEFDATTVSARTAAEFGPRGRGAGDWGKGEIDPQAPFDVEDFALAFIRLRSGRTVLLESSWAAHQPDPDFNGTQLFGTEAGLLLPPLRLFRPGPRGHVTELVDPGLVPVTPTRLAHFVDVVLGRDEPFVRLDESVAVQKILDALYRSAALGCEVSVEEMPG
jgi:predicted dehydrogenase